MKNRFSYNSTLGLKKTAQKDIEQKDTLPFERSYWLIPKLVLAGEYPASISPEETKIKLQGLADVGIKTVINLTEADEVNRDSIRLYDYKSDLEALGLNVYRMPIQDLNIPIKDEMRAIISLIDKSIEENKPVYFHCWGGVGRTGTVAGCFLLHSEMANNKNVFELINHLKRNTSIKNRLSPETKEQRRFVLNFLSE